MAAYRRVYDSCLLQADCQEAGSAPEPYGRQSSMGYLFVALCILIPRRAAGWVVQTFKPAHLSDCSLAIRSSCVDRGRLSTLAASLVARMNGASIDETTTSASRLPGLAIVADLVTVVSPDQQRTVSK